MLYIIAVKIVTTATLINTMSFVLYLGVSNVNIITPPKNNKGQINPCLIHVAQCTPRLFGCVFYYVVPNVFQ
jgi:hypothetical protein